MNKRDSRVRSASLILKQHRGANILTENIIFILLTLIFFAILITFIFSRTTSAVLIEEELAKQIALIVDSAKPETIIKINVEEAIQKAEKEKYSGNIIIIEKNLVTVKLREKGGYSYSFFNDVDASAFPDVPDSDGKIKNYVIFVSKK